MRVTGVREFRDHAPELIKGKDLVFVTRHGKLTSVLVPLNDPVDLPIELRRELLQSLGGAISSHLKKRGVGEKQVTREFAAWRKKRRSHRSRR